MSDDTTSWNRIVSAFIWVLAGGFLVFMLSLLTILYRFVGPDRVQFLERFYCRAQLALTFNRQVHHVDPKVDPGTQYIFIQNHTSHLDHVAMYTATPHFKQGIELESHFEYPFYGWFMKARGTIPVPKDRQGALEALRRAVREEVDRGHSILGFPEGHRTLTGHVGPFYDGIFRIAIELGVPVVPVAVTGLYEVLHKGSLVVRPGNTITVVVGEPIHRAGAEARDETEEPVLAPDARRPPELVPAEGDAGEEREEVGADPLSDDLLDHDPHLFVDVEQSAFGTILDRIRAKGRRVDLGNGVPQRLQSFLPRPAVRQEQTLVFARETGTGAILQQTRAANDDRTIPEILSTRQGLRNSR